MLLLHAGAYLMLPLHAGAYFAMLSHAAAYFMLLLHVQANQEHALKVRYTRPGLCVCRLLPSSPFHLLLPLLLLSSLQRAQRSA